MTGQRWMLCGERTSLGTRPGWLGWVPVCAAGKGDSQARLSSGGSIFLLI